MTSKRNPEAKAVDRLIVLLLKSGKHSVGMGVANPATGEMDLRAEIEWGSFTATCYPTTMCPQLWMKGRELPLTEEQAATIAASMTATLQEIAKHAIDFQTA
jgi:hypothetical protein